MSPWLLAIVAIIYCFVSYDLFQSNQIGLSLAFAAYSVSNVGLILATFKW